MARQRLPRVIFARAGWMVWYDYSRERHAPIGGGSYNDSEVGSEVNNFRSYRGVLYGYARIGYSSGFNLRRVDPTAESDLVENVLVLLYATEPNVGGQRLVGWYQNAQCHARVLKRPYNLYGAWHFQTQADDAVLLPLSQRTNVASAKGDGGFGESHVRYAWGKSGEWELLPWMRDAIAFAKNYQGPNLLRGADPGYLSTHQRAGHAGQGWGNDPAARKAVETHAMNIAATFFRQHGYHVDSDVHRYQPYDLLCSKRSGALLRVEVKGTTGNAENVLLTAGEVLVARQHEVPIALFVVSNIELTFKRNRWLARAGVPGWIADWKPSYRDLKPVTYTYRLPLLKAV